MARISAVIVFCLLSSGLAATAASPDADTTTAARVERVLHGLRPKVEVEGMPVRWSLTERMAAYQVPAVSIAIIDGGRVAWAQGFGVTEAGGKVPVTATTLFQAASCGKPVAASAMLRLVDKGTLALDTKVNDYLTSWKLPDNEFTKKEPVTLRRIVNHTAGTTVGGFPGYAIGAPRPTLLEILDGKAPASSVPVRVDSLPGQKFRYSGGGYIILQQLLCDVSGTSFPMLLQQQVLGPLGMMHSTFEQPLPEARATEAARGHEKSAVVPGGWHVYPELAAAGLWTTPTDMARWAIAMADVVTGRSTKFLSPATATQIISAAVPGRRAQERIGLGLFLSGSGDKLTFSHGGQNEGFLNEFKVFPAGNQGAVIMINTGESGYGLIQELQLAIAAEFAWPEIGTTRIPAVAVDADSLERLTGTYAIDIKSGRKLPRVVREGTRLFLEGWGTERREMYPQSPTTFIDTRGTRFTFSRDANGAEVMTMGNMRGLKLTETAKALGLEKELVLDLGGNVALKLVLIPAGKFVMGSPETEKDRLVFEGPQHPVTISSAYYLGATEVTQRQYEAVMGKNPSSFKAPDSPVENVTWNEAAEFCGKLSERIKKKVRLPTEAEWEYACRAGTKTLYSFRGNLNDYAWFSDNAGKKTHPVGQKKPNPFGLYDMHGNVWEWCSDWYGEKYYAHAEAVDPRGPDMGKKRSLRGGAWAARPQRCTTAVRGGGDPVARANYIGFRAVVAAATTD